MNKDILLSKATRNDLIDELKKRDSVTHIYLSSKDDGCMITTSSGKISLNGQLYIFVVRPFKELSE